MDIKIIVPNTIMAKDEETKIDSIPRLKKLIETPPPILAIKNLAIVASVGHFIAFAPCEAK